MPDTALDNAVKQRDDLAAKINAAQQQVDEWRRDLARADAFIAEWHAFAGTAPPEQAFVVTPARSDVPIPKRLKTKSNSKKELVAAEARRIIEERQSPVSRKELYDTLIDRGLVIEGTEPEMVLSTMLWRAGSAAGVVRLNRGGYWLKERDWKPARYYPELREKLKSKGLFATPFYEGEPPEDKGSVE